MWICLPFTLWFLPKLSFIDKQTVLSTLMVFHTILLLIKEFFIGKEMCQLVHAHRIHWSYHITHHAEAAGSIELWNGLFKPVTALAKWQYLARLRQGYPEGYLGSQPVTNIWCCFFHSYNPWSRNQVMEMGVKQPAITPSDPLAKILLPLSKTLCSVGMEVFFSKEGMLPLEDTVTMSLNWKLKLPLTFRNNSLCFRIKERSYCAVGGDWVWLPWENWTIWLQ